LLKPADIRPKNGKEDRAFTSEAQALKGPEKKKNTSQSHPAKVPAEEGNRWKWNMRITGIGGHCAIV
jgi:hypothetical protein